jgi:hypothetical protein
MLIPAPFLLGLVPLSLGGLGEGLGPQVTAVASKPAKRGRQKSVFHRNSVSYYDLIGLGS